MSLPYCDIHTVLRVGANADIANNKGKTPLQRAQIELAGESDPEKKQDYEKVQEHTHTISHFDVANVC